MNKHGLSIFDVCWCQLDHHTYKPDLKSPEKCFFIKSNKFSFSLCKRASFVWGSFHHHVKLVRRLSPRCNITYGEGSFLGNKKLNTNLLVVRVTL